MEYMIFEYRESFAMPGLVATDDITILMAELDPFLDGFFLALAVANAIGVLAPAVEAIRHVIEHDEKQGLSRVSVVVKLRMNTAIEKDHAKIQQFLNDSMSTFLASRFGDMAGDNSVDKLCR